MQYLHIYSTYTCLLQSGPLPSPHISPQRQIDHPHNPPQTTHHQIQPNPNTRTTSKKMSGRESPPPLPTNAEDLKRHKALSSMESTSTVSSTDDAPGSGSSSSDPSALGAALGSITSKPALALTSKPTAVVKVKAEDVAFIVSLSLSLSPFPIQGCRCLMSDV